jgi:hypothetical protein
MLLSSLNYVNLALEPHVVVLLHVVFVEAQHVAHMRSRHLGLQDVLEHNPALIQSEVGPECDAGDSTGAYINFSSAYLFRNARLILDQSLQYDRMVE